MLSCPRPPVLLDHREFAPAPPARRRPIIGLVTFTTHRGDLAEAILDIEGRWHCPKLPALNRVLNILFDPMWETSGGSAFGHEQLVRVASWLKGRVRDVVIEDHV